MCNPGLVNKYLQFRLIWNSYLSEFINQIMFELVPSSAVSERKSDMLNCITGETKVRLLCLQGANDSARTIYFTGQGGGVGS